MAAETGLPPAAKCEEKSEEQSRGVPLWLVVLAALALGGLVELIIYGYLERPGRGGVANEKFWDYLELLIVPAALALGVYWLNRRQEERNREADAMRETERAAGRMGRTAALPKPLPPAVLLVKPHPSPRLHSRVCIPYLVTEDPGFRALPKA
jgi:hypothetical protein